MSRKKHNATAQPSLYTKAAVLFITRCKTLPDFDKLMNRHGDNVVHVQEENDDVPPHKTLALTGQNPVLYSISLPSNWKTGNG